MDFEIIEAYPIKFDGKSKSQGWSLHIYFPDLDLDLRGIRMMKSGQGWWCEMPHLRNWDDEQNRVVFFPLISFTNSEKTRKLKQNIKAKATEFIKEKVETK